MDRRRREETRKDHHQNGPPDPKLDLTIITAVVGTRVLFEKLDFTAVAEFVFPSRRKDLGRLAFFRYQKLAVAWTREMLGLFLR